MFFSCMTLLIIVRSLTLYSEVIQVDESDFATYGAIWATGGTPYVDFVDNKPPLCYAFYAISNLLFGNNMIAVHSIMILWIAITSWFIMLLARTIGYNRAGPWAALLYSAWTVCFPATATLPANSENMFNLPSAIAAYCYLKSGTTDKKNNKSILILLAGIFIAIASLFKHQAGILLCVIIVHIVYEAILRQTSKWKALYDILILACGFVIPWAIFFIYFIRHDALSEALTYNFYNNIHYVNSHFDYARFLSRLSIRTSLFILANLPLFVCATYACVNLKENIKWFFIFWVIGAMLAVSAGGHFSPHYYVQVWPPIILLAALGWFKITELEIKRWRTNLLAISFIIIPLIFSSVHWWSYFSRWFEPREPVIKELTDEVIKRTSERDKIFIWGYFSYPYYFANRLPATRFVTCQYIVPYWEKKMAGATEFSISEMMNRHELAYKQLMDDLLKYTPKLIIDTTNSHDFTYWLPFDMKNFREYQTLVTTHYHHVKDIRGMAIYERN